MSRTQPSATEAVARRIECPYCGAKPGVWCQTDTGNWATYLHDGRSRPIYDVHSLGFTEGMRDSYAGVLWELENAGRWPRGLPRDWKVPDLVAWLQERIQVTTHWQESAQARAEGRE